MKPGRKPTSTVELKLHGGYRADRHSARADAAPPVGIPVKPEGFGADESALWDCVVPDRVERKLVGSADTPALVAMCEQWGLYRASLKLAKDDPTDKEIRCAVTGYLGMFYRFAAAFGLTTADMASLKVSPEKPTGLSTRRQAQ